MENTSCPCKKEKCIRHFNVIKSHYVIVTYNDANSEDIITALNSGRATIADLDEFDIEYTKKPKS